MQLWGPGRQHRRFSHFSMGEYLEDGYEVEVLPFTNPGDQKTALLAGELDMTGTTMVTAITAAEKGEPIRIVAGLCNKCSALVVKGFRHKKPEDLKGKHIAYVPGTMHHALLLEVLKRAGLDADKDVELLQIDFFDMGQALREGSIDAFLSGEPYPSEALLDGYGEILEYPYFDDSIGTINAAMIVREETIREEPGKVQALVNAHVKAPGPFRRMNKSGWTLPISSELQRRLWISRKKIWNWGGTLTRTLLPIQRLLQKR